MSAPLIAERLARQIRWEDLDPEAIQTVISLARREDLEGWGLALRPSNPGDLTSRLLPRRSAPARASLVARESLVVCGLRLIPWILEAYGREVWFTAATQDGARLGQGGLLGQLNGPACTLLEAERVILNFLQRLSGVASLTSTYVDALGDSTTRLLDTRKTTPGLRVLEKYAVACGGGFNHRIGLFDRIMLKDNHLAAAGASTGAALGDLVTRARASSPDGIIELEVDRLEQIPPALEAGIENLLLDNFSTEALLKAVELVGDQAALEASGGITLERLPALAGIGLDFISTGATIHQSRWTDIGLDWD